jgi:SAM-dependent methyltransferase
LNVELHVEDSGTAEVERLLADDQPELFAAIGALDWYASSHRRWVDGLNLGIGTAVLEVGCATGALTAHLAGRGFRVTGLDSSEDMIARGRRDHPDQNLVVGDVMSLPYDSGSFDVVVAASVVNIVSDPENALLEMQRVCVPGGVVSVLAPSVGFSDADLDALVEKMGVTGFSAAALTKWHRGPSKMAASALESLFIDGGAESVVTSSYLSGMLCAVTATTESERGRDSGGIRETARASLDVPSRAGAE